MCKWGNPFYLTFYFQAAAGPKDYGAALNHDPATLPLLQTIDPFVSELGTHLPTNPVRYYSDQWPLYSLYHYLILIQRLGALRGTITTYHHLMGKEPNSYF